jgi:aspartate/methionine/tyrosine aminotransferase
MGVPENEGAMRVAQRTQHLRAEGAYHMLAQAQALEAEGRRIVHLEVGEPDFLASEEVLDAGVEALRAGRARYNPPAGLPALREAIAESAGRQRAIEIQPGQVLVSPGAKPNMFFPTLALIEAGDEVIYPDPGFPSYAAMIGVAGGRGVPVPVVEARGFSFDLEAFDRSVSDRTRLIILNSPANPTGGVIPRHDLEHIAAAAQRHGIWVISDEIYTRITFEGGIAPSIASLPGMQERTVIVDGYSKTYAMSGWRLGYGIMPEALARRVELLLTHAYGCTAEFTQWAAVEALHGSQAWVAAMVAEYRRRRDRLVAGLNRIPGVRCREPQGAFYAFPNVTALGIDVDDLAERILRQAGVALLPGTAFGANCAGYLRLSYATSMENLEQGLEKIEAFVRSEIRD